MKNIFVDTSAWYALVDADDSDHKAAVAFHTGNTIPLVYHNFTIDNCRCRCAGTCLPDYAKILSPELPVRS